MDKVFTFYTPEGAAALEVALASFDGAKRWRTKHLRNRAGRSILLRRRGGRDWSVDL